MVCTLIQQKFQSSFSVTWTHPLFSKLFISTDFSMSVTHFTFLPQSIGIYGANRNVRFVSLPDSCLGFLPDVRLFPCDFLLWAQSAAALPPVPLSDHGGTQPTSPAREGPRPTALYFRGGWDFVFYLYQKTGPFHMLGSRRSYPIKSKEQVL